jgi:hypothetical protein
VPVRVDHPRHHDAARGINLHGVVGRGERMAHGLDLLADDQHIPVLDHFAGRIDGQHRGAAEDHRAPLR